MKRVVFTLLMAATLMVSGIAAMKVSAAADTAAVTTQTTGTPPADMGTLSTETKLIAGIYSLYGTSNAISAEQAASLKTLFQSYLTLEQSTLPTQSGTPQAPAAQSTPDPAATPQARPTVSAETQAQMDALLTQIQAVLTSTQLQAMDALNLTPQTAMEVIQKYGGMGAGPGGNGSGPSTSGGQPPAGGQQSGNGQPPSAGTQAQGTPQAPANGQGGQPPSGGQMPQGRGGPGGSQMVEAFITFLDKVSTGQTVSTQTAPAASAAGS